MQVLSLTDNTISRARRLGEVMV